MPTAQKMTDVSLSIFRSKFKKTRIQMIDYSYSASSVRGLALVSPWPATGSTKASGHYPTAGS